MTTAHEYRAVNNPIDYQTDQEVYNNALTGLLRAEAVRMNIGRLVARLTERPIDSDDHIDINQSAYELLARISPHRAAEITENMNVLKQQQLEQRQKLYATGVDERRNVRRIHTGIIYYADPAAVPEYSEPADVINIAARRKTR